MLKYFILIIFMYSVTSLYAQENINMIEILNIEQDIIFLEKRIMSLIKKNSVIANIQGFKQFHIIWLGSDTNRKEDFFDCSFFGKLFLADHYQIKSGFLFWKKQEYIKATTIITDSVGNLIAKGDVRLVHVAPVFGKQDIRLAKMFFDKEIDFVFLLGFPFLMRYMVGIKDNTLYALEGTKEGLKVYSWDEFMACCFDEWAYRIRK